MDERVNPGRYLENLVEDVLAQRIFAVDFAYGFTRLEKHLGEFQQWWEPQGDPSLDQGLKDLQAAMDHIRAFVEQKNLGELDRGLASARSATWSLEEGAARAAHAGHPVNERLRLAPALERDWQERWEGQVFRHQGEARMVFRCKTCDWEFAFVAEAPAQEVEIPFSELSCPFCD